MVFVSELFSLCVYIVQELGIIFAVGAQTVLLVAYLLTIHSDNDEHVPLMRASKYVLGMGLVAVAASGTGAVALHILTEQYDVLFAPAFIFKWILIFAAVGAYIWDDHFGSQPPLAQASARGLAGGFWYGMLLVHLVAPVIEWLPLLLLFMSWILVFMAFWSVFVGIMHWSAPKARAARAQRAKVKAEERAQAKAVAQEKEQAREIALAAEIKQKEEQKAHQEAESKAKTKAEAEVKKQKEKEAEQHRADEAAAAAKAAEEANRKAAEDASHKAAEAERLAEEAHAKEIAEAEAKRKLEEEAKQKALETLAPLPVIVPPELPPPHAKLTPPPLVPTPAVAPPPEPSSLPTIRVMPRTPEDLIKHQ